MTIEQEIAQLRGLKNTAGAIVDFVRAMAAGSQSDFVGHSGEWLLEPDTWINLKFTYRRALNITISLGVYPTTLDDLKAPELEIRQGRQATWAKIVITSATQLPAAFKMIEKAFYYSDNSYRAKHGKPKKKSFPQKAGSSEVFDPLG